MAERDPRSDPRPGDVLRHPLTVALQVTVDYVQLDHPSRSTVAYSIGDMAHSCTLVEWQSWARTATIISRSGE